MSFDQLAPHYRWMEWLLAGNKLQRCRTACFDLIPAPKHALLLGEGNGRFLIALLRKYPGIRITCLDASAAMLDCARQRLRQTGLRSENVQWIHADILKWQPGSQQFDLVVTNFFLDCFSSEQVEQIVQHLGRSAAPGARWLLADFCEPPSGGAKWRARLILSSMYCFFRVITRIPAKKLTAPDAALMRNGFRLRERKLSEWRLLHADLWTRD